jgi:nitroreductase
MPTPNQAALDFLLTRRSYPARTLTLPIPDDAALRVLLSAASRVPDHGKLEPWRFIVLTKPALTRIAGLVPARGTALGIDPEKITKSVAQYADTDLAVVVVASPKPTDKIPALEQTYSAGAACLSLVNAALAAGWGANWLSGWPSYDRTFVTEAFHLAPHESVAGVIHIGTISTVPPDRPRPAVDSVTTWLIA